MTLLLAASGGYTSTEVEGPPAAFWVAMVVISVVAFLVFFVPYVIGFWKVLEKAGRPGWGALVPIYNNWLVIEVVGRPGWWLALMFVPYASIVILVILMIDLAKSFGKSPAFGWGLALLPPVFMLLLGFGDATYLGPSVPPEGGYAPVGATPAGWYPDPWQQAPYRWWDGRGWTSYTG